MNGSHLLNFEVSDVGKVLVMRYFIPPGYPLMKSEFSSDVVLLKFLLSGLLLVYELMTSYIQVFI